MYISHPRKNLRYTPPLQLPLAIFTSESGCLAIDSIASTCPSKAATNGFANILSIFTAFSARARSRARAKGCMRGSRFRDWGVGSPGRVGRCCSGACCKTDIRYFSELHDAGRMLYRSNSQPYRRQRKSLKKLPEITRLSNQMVLLKLCWQQFHNNNFVNTF